MLEGTLDSFSLPDIFQLLHGTRKTGRLSLSDEGCNGAVWFVDGRVRYASSTSGRLALGRRLVGAGLLASDDLIVALARQDELRRDGLGTRIGQLLVELEAIDRPTLVTHVLEQVTDAVFDLMRWTTGSFRFEPGTDASLAAEDVLVDMAVDTLVAEAANRMEHWGRVERFVPSRDAVVHLVVVPDAAGTDVPASADVTISREEWRLVALVDGRRTVADLVAIHGQGEYHTSRLLCGLVEAGIVAVARDGEHAAPAVAELLHQQQMLTELDDERPPQSPAAAGDDARADVDPDLVRRLIAGVQDL